MDAGHAHCSLAARTSLRMVSLTKSFWFIACSSVHIWNLCVTGALSHVRASPSAAIS